MGLSFVGCTVLIYDNEGNQIGTNEVSKYDKLTQYLSLRRLLPQEISDLGSRCIVLILSSPSPREYRGTVVRDGTNVALALYKGKDKEGRSTTRYKVGTKAVVVALTREGRPLNVDSSKEVIVMNISQRGMRLCAASHTFTMHDILQLQMIFGANERLIVAEVVNMLDKENGLSEYGCRLIGGK